MALTLFPGGAKEQSVQVFSNGQGSVAPISGYSPSHDFALEMAMTKTVSADSLSFDNIHLTNLDDTYTILADNVKSLTITVTSISVLGISPSYSQNAESGSTGCGIELTPSKVKIPLLGVTPSTGSYSFLITWVKLDSSKPVTLQVKASRPMHIDGNYYSTSIDITGFPSGTYAVTRGSTVVERIYIDDAPPSSYTLNLNAGWNLVSLPIQPEDNHISYIFSESQQSNIDVIWDYNGGSWQYWTTEAPWNQNNPLQTLNPRTGYWIYCYNPMSVTIYGTSPPPVKTWDELAAGWNCVGYPSTSSTSVSGLWGPADVVWKYDAGNWYYYTTEADYAASSTISSLEPGYGYWVYKL